MCRTELSLVIFFGFKKSKRKILHSVFYVQQYCTVHFINKLSSATVQHYLNKILLNHKEQQMSVSTGSRAETHQRTQPYTVPVCNSQPCCSTSISLSCLKQRSSHISFHSDPNPVRTVPAQSHDFPSIVTFPSQTTQSLSAVPAYAAPLSSLLLLSHGQKTSLLFPAIEILKVWVANLTSSSYPGLGWVACNH